MEATGVYWIPIYEILEGRGLEVLAVNARHVKNVPGRKSDVTDCEWLQQLHSVGLLKGSFRPTAKIAALRSYVRHRETLHRPALSLPVHPTAGRCRKRPSASPGRLTRRFRATLRRAKRSVGYGAPEVPTFSR
jgi:hypothetical protein